MVVDKDNRIKQHTQRLDTLGGNDFCYLQYIDYTLHAVLGKCTTGPHEVCLPACSTSHVQHMHHTCCGSCVSPSCVVLATATADALAAVVAGATASACACAFA
jgi:hypothetical protein